MAQEANGQKFCKVVHTENGRTWTRRIHTIMVQAADGRLHHLAGVNLPDSISLYSGVPYSGAHMSEVLLSPKRAQGVPLLPNSSGWLSQRDAFFLVFGMFSFWLIATLAEGAAPRTRSIVPLHRRDRSVRLSRAPFSCLKFGTLVNGKNKICRKDL